VPFGYLKDPLFLFCFTVYWLNRFLEDCGISAPIVRSYLNDLICIPFWCPIMLWANRRLGLRRHDSPPLAYEIVIPLLIVAIVFEVILPASRGWEDLTFADPNDVLSYALGAAFATIFWAWWYREQGNAVHPSDRKLA